MCVDIWYCNAKCRLVGVYRSTDCKQQSEPYVRQLVQCLESLTRVTWPCYITGDFNAGTVDWLNLATTHHCVDNILIDFAVNNGHNQEVGRYLA